MHAIRQSCSDLSGEETEHSFERAEAAIEVEQIRGRAGETSGALTQARTSRINQAELRKGRRSARDPRRSPRERAFPRVSRAHREYAGKIGRRNAVRRMLR